MGTINASSGMIDRTQTRMSREDIKTLLTKEGFLVEGNSDYISRGCSSLAKDTALGEIERDEKSDRVKVYYNCGDIAILLKEKAELYEFCVAMNVPVREINGGINARVIKSLMERLGAQR